MTKFRLSNNDQEVKQKIASQCSEMIENIFDVASAQRANRDIEVAIWANIINIGHLLMTGAMQVKCRTASEEDIESRGLKVGQIILRTMADYHGTMMTTFGEIKFMTFAYRDRTTPLPVTRNPARGNVIPYNKRCRSSELCLEFECLLGSDHPFRKAQEALNYFTHGAVKLEDNTIARHMNIINSLVDRKWLYRPLEEIREILTKQATLDNKTCKPLVYFSSDAFSATVYEGETWNTCGKMVNGVRMWCINRKNNTIIHLGGEYTWGDCHQVERIIKELIQAGYLPEQGDYGDGIIAELVVITDGATWIKDHIINQLPWANAILDVYHALDNLSKYYADRYGKGSVKARKHYQEAAELLLGPKPKKKKKAKLRKKEQEKERKKDNSLVSQEKDDGEVEAEKPEERAVKKELSPKRMPGAEMVLELLLLDDKVSVNMREKHYNICRYMANNLYRMDYELYRHRGFQIGSGAMEALHRNIQNRIRITGACWLEETSSAIFNLRMMCLARQWKAFWTQKDLTVLLTDIFEGKAVRKNRDGEAVSEEPKKVINIHDYNDIDEVENMSKVA